MKDKIVRIRADEDEWYPVIVFSDCENGFGIEVTEQERLNLLEIQKIRDEALNRLTSAESAVKQLQDVANRSKDGRAANLAVLLKSIQATTEALHRLH